MASDFELLHELTILGNSFSLLPFLDPNRVQEQLAPFAQNWQPYNPKKGDFRRWGLSVTSLDGGLSGMPDLTSISEHNLQNGTDYNEMSFGELTPVYKACTEIHSIVEPFRPYLGRSHFLKFGKGGFFPWHRDSVGAREKVFRIFVPLYTHSDRDFIFLLEDRRLNLEKGHPYFINTFLEHSVISFTENSVHLVLNIKLCPEAVRTVHRLLSVN